MPYAEGTVSASTYKNSIISALTNNPIGETNVSAEFSVTLTGSQNSVQLTMPSLAGGVFPSGWRIYRGTSSGTETLIATLPGDLTKFTDDGSVTSSSTTVPATGYGSLGGLPLNIGTPTSLAQSGLFLDQQFTANNGNEYCSYDQSLAQAFVPNYGKISAIDLPLTLNGAPTGNVVVSIYNSTYNQPNTGGTTLQNYPQTQSNAVPIATVSVATASVANFNGTSNFTRFTFASPVSLTVGQVYYMVITLDTAANTHASGNYVLIAGRIGAGLTSLTPTFNDYLYGARTVLTGTTNWSTTTANTGLNYKIYATGNMSLGTYYYKVSAITGWAQKYSYNQYYENNSNLYNTTVLFSSGQNSNENIYVSFGQGGSDQYQNLTLGILEYIDLNTHNLGTYQNAAFTNGTSISGTTASYNWRTFVLECNTASIGANTNVTYRMHYKFDHIFLDIAGDSTISNWTEYGCFVGKIVALNPADNCYVICDSSAWGSFQQLRDFGSTVNTDATGYFLMKANRSLGSNANQDSFIYLNQYTNKYDGILYYVGDLNYGIRGYIPDLYLYPSNITSVINNHDTFTVNGQTYKFYLVQNKQQFGWDSITGNAQFAYFYPAVNMS